MTQVSCPRSPLCASSCRAGQGTPAQTCGMNSLGRPPRFMGLGVDGALGPSAGPSWQLEAELGAEAGWHGQAHNCGSE